MNVKKLKEKLKDLPDDMNIMLQRDSEGNGYEHLRGTDPNGIFRGEGEVLDGNWTAEDADLSEEDWKALKSENPRVLVLYP